MKVNSHFKLEIKARLLNEQIGIVIWLVVGVLAVAPLIAIKIMESNISYPLKAISLTLLFLWLGALLYYNFTNLFKYRNIIVEVLEDNEKIKAITYSGKNIVLYKENTIIEKYSCIIWRERLKYTDGRNIIQGKEKYFIPDSEFQKSEL